MKLSFPAFSAVALAASMLAGTASAQVIEVGSSSTPLVAPTCPKGVKPAACKIVLTRVTALETLNDGRPNPTTIRHAGDLVALTVGLSKLSSRVRTRNADIKYLNSQYGGSPRGWISVLRPYGPRSRYGWQVAASSPVIYFQHYLGQVAQFPLRRPVPVVRGERIALTIPTWAPVLSIDLKPNRFAYRQSRNFNCAVPPTSQQAQRRIGQIAHYKCNYKGTRVEYSVTEVTTPRTSS